MPRVLITGASGFVGRSTAACFEESGWTVTRVGRRALDAGNYHRLDLERATHDAIRQLVQGHDVVVHAAARSSPWGSRRQFYKSNVLATQKIIDACEASSRPKLIFISSSSVYYKPQDQIGLTEDMPLATPPVNLYAGSKQIAEALIRKYQGQSIILRPRAVYGRDDTVLFPRILTAAKAGRLPLLVRSGSPVVGDLISIQNLARYIVRSAEIDCQSDCYNLTDNHPIEIISFLMEIFDALGIQRPKRSVSTKMAFRVATVLEAIHRVFLPWVEPPITRFGVHVFAYSKTFDVNRCIKELGPPDWTTQQAVDDFVQWIRTESPYEKK